MSFESQGGYSLCGAGTEGLKPTDNSNIIDFFKSTCLDFIEVIRPGCVGEGVLLDIRGVLIGYDIIDIFPVVRARIADFAGESSMVGLRPGFKAVDYSITGSPGSL